MSRLDLNLLLVLYTVLSEGSVVGAARRLHVTPSAVSNGLARLCTAVGDPPGRGSQRLHEQPPSGARR